jgi:hypothetical protein
VPRGQRDGSLRPFSEFSVPEPRLSLFISSSVVLKMLIGPVPDPLLRTKSDSGGNRTRASGSIAKNSDH